MSNLYEAEASITKNFENYGNGTLTVLLLLGAVVIVLIALFSHSIILKSLVLAYIVLP